MKNKLQYLLKKYNEKKLNCDEINNLMSCLKSMLEDYQSITDEEIKSLISFQDNDGGFSLINDTKIPWDVKHDLIYFPSYYITLILVKISNLTNTFVYNDVIMKSLDFCCKHKFIGHGYTATQTQINVANLFVENGIKEYIKNKHLEDSNLAKLLNELVDEYTQLILSGNIYGSWGECYLDGMQRYINNMDDSIYYVAYGSNLNKNQMMYRCPEAECVGPAILENYRLKFNLYLTVEQDENSYIPVGIWKITKNDERKLDRYEGFPRLYRKEYVEVKVNKIIRKCLIYIMNFVPDRMNRKPPIEYLERCQKGYEDFGFDPKELLNVQ